MVDVDFARTVADPALIGGELREDAELPPL